MILNKGDHSILYPFGNFIYRGKLNEEELIWMQDFAERSRKGEDASPGLVGNIKDQRRGTPTSGNEDTLKFTEIFHTHLVNYYKHQQEKISIYLENPIEYQNHKDEDSPYIKILNNDLDTMRYHLHDGPWFNFMKANEFNPLHAHFGEISAICMVKVPDEIENELHSPDPDKKNFKAAGKLEFVGNDGSDPPYKVVSETGHVYLFPANMRHQVYPFSCDVERITCSWNYVDITMDQKMEIEYG